MGEPKKEGGADDDDDAHDRERSDQQLELRHQAGLHEEGVGDGARELAAREALPPEGRGVL